MTRAARLTIGELFPDGDLAAQWVFSVTSLYEDLQATFRPLPDALSRRDLRALLASHRATVTRLYEARRLIFAVGQHPDVHAFAAPLLEPRPAASADLQAAYHRRADSEPSLVERLYGELRHTTVHYMKVGSRELRDTLRQHSRLPAEVELLRDSSGRPDVWFKWVHAVSGMQVLGDPAQTDFLREMQRRGQLTAALVSAWSFVASTALAAHLHRLGIDANRLGEIPAAPSGHR